jgi:hypothetical protein
MKKGTKIFFIIAICSLFISNINVLAEDFENFDFKIEKPGLNQDIIIDYMLVSYNNSPPNTPSKPVGNTTGETWVYYLYTTSSSDPDNDSIRYGWDGHGDHIIDFWTPYYTSGQTVGLYIRFLTPGIFHISVKAEDVHGAQSNFSESLTVYIYENENNPPDKPDTPSGPDEGFANIEINFLTSSTDPDEDLISYGWDWNADSIIDEWTGFVSSGSTCIASHSWELPGIYNIKVRAMDINGAYSEFSNIKTITIIDSNNPPNKPSRPSGSTTGKVGVSYSYESLSIDPEDNNIYYMFDWDDGTISDWHGPYPSGGIISISHIWNKSGTYQLKVKAKDDPNNDGDLSDGLESYWSDPLPIAMPKQKHYQLLIQQFLENYPLFYKILQKFNTLI